MKNSYGHFKYCVASVNIYSGTPTVSFYAYTNDVYGLHRVDNYDSPDIVWYEDEADALKARWNSNDCVLCRWFDV